LYHCELSTPSNQQNAEPNSRFLASPDYPVCAAGGRSVIEFDGLKTAQLSQAVCAKVRGLNMARPKHEMIY
jgi:hypothetical protein